MRSGWIWLPWFLFWRKGGLGCVTLGKNFSADENIDCYLSGFV
jgi:hypothetical protein